MLDVTAKLRFCPSAIMQQHAHRQVAVEKNLSG